LSHRKSFIVIYIIGVTLSIYHSNSLIAIACEYARRNWHVFPCHTLEGDKCSCGNPNCGDIAKHPLTEHGCKDASIDVMQLDRYFTGDYNSANIAIATGSISGVMVLDVDNPTALKQLEQQYGSLPKTVVCQTGSGGKHYYFRHDQRCDKLKNAVKFAGALDVRANGGYVLLPPSLHKSGNRYEWLVSPDDCELAELPDWLYDLMPKRNEALPIARKEQTATNGISVKHEAKKKDSIGGVGLLTIGNAPTDTERLSLYLKSCPPAISGEGGHKHTYATICRVVELFGNMNDDDILSALDTWNSRCSPPWKDSDLRHKLADARKNVTQQPTDYHDEPEPTDEDDGDCNSLNEEQLDVPIALSSDAFYGIVGDICRAIEPETEADIAGVLISLLACVGNAIGKKPSFDVGGDTHHANLFVFLVGNTASGKGQAWGIASHLMKRIEEQWARECIAYGLSSGEGLIERVGDEELQNDGKTIVIPPTKRLLCLETEAMRPLVAMSREGNTLSGVLRSAWDGNTLEVNTRNSRLRASSAFVSVVAHITPDELRRILDKSVESTNGFANRFLWCVVSSNKMLPHGGDITVINPFVEPLKNAIAKAKTITTMRRTTEADQLWATVYSGLRQSSVKATERGRPQVVRLSMLYALLDGSDTINESHLRAALAVWRYCEESALRLFDNNALALRLRETIRKSPGIRRRELQRSISHRLPADAFARALRWLMERGDIVAVADGGQQTERYYSSPKRPHASSCESVRVGDNASESSVPLSPRPRMSDSKCNATVPVSPVPHAIATGESENDSSPNNLTATKEERPAKNVSQTLNVINKLITNTTTINDGVVESSGDRGTEGQTINASSHPTTHEDAPAHRQPLTLSQLIDWRNAHGIRFVRNDDGGIWVTTDYESLLTPAIKSAIRANQQTLSMFVGGSAKANDTLSYSEVTIVDDDDDNSWYENAGDNGKLFYDDLNAYLALTDEKKKEYLSFIYTFVPTAKEVQYAPDLRDVPTIDELSHYLNINRYIVELCVKELREKNKIKAIEREDGKEAWLRTENKAPENGSK
jgi:hypothetical protein